MGAERPTIQECMNDHSEDINSHQEDLTQLDKQLETLEGMMRDSLPEEEINKFYDELGFDNANALKDALIEAFKNPYARSTPTAVNEVIASKSSFESQEFVTRVDSVGFNRFYEGLILYGNTKPFFESYKLVADQRINRTSIIDDTHNNLPDCIRDSSGEINFERHLGSVEWKYASKERAIIFLRKFGYNYASGEEIEAAAYWMHHLKENKGFDENFQDLETLSMMRAIIDYRKNRNIEGIDLPNSGEKSIEEVFPGIQLD